MPRKNPRFTVALPEELLDAVVDYQHRHKLKTQNLAINELVRNGMDAVERELGLYNVNEEITASSRALGIAAKFDQLDSYGKDAVSAIVDAEYRRCNGSSSITTAVQHAVRNGETEDSIATVITLYSRAGEDARSKALDVLADDDGRGFKAENDAVLGRHVGQIIGKDTDAANVE